MERYKNLGANSGIIAYEIDDQSITVEFQDGSVYLYTYDSAGAENIERMKKLAIAGEGLNSFINTTPSVRKGYKQKFR